MQINFATYIPGNSVVHACDARVKLVALFVYSLALLLLPWWGVVALGVLFLAALCASRVPVWRILGPVMIPVYVLAVIALVCNGLPTGVIVALRIMLLVAMSLLVSYTTTSTQVMRALAWLLQPLGRLHVPVRDIVLALSLALRFIPVVAEEFCRVHDAQAARGSSFARGSFWARAKAWGRVFVSLFVALFRRADNLAAALDSRCYGAEHDKI